MVPRPSSSEGARLTASCGHVVAKECLAALGCRRSRHRHRSRPQLHTPRVRELARRGRRRSSPCPRAASTPFVLATSWLRALRVDPAPRSTHAFSHPPRPEKRWRQGVDNPTPFRNAASDPAELSKDNRDDAALSPALKECRVMTSEGHFHFTGRVLPERYGLATRIRRRTHHRDVERPGRYNGGSDRKPGVRGLPRQAPGDATRPEGSCKSGGQGGGGRARLRKRRRPGRGDPELRRARWKLLRLRYWL